MRLPIRPSLLTVCPSSIVFEMQRLIGRKSAFLLFLPIPVSFEAVVMWPIGLGHSCDGVIQTKLGWINTAKIKYEGMKVGIKKLVFAYSLVKTAWSYHYYHHYLSLHGTGLLWQTDGRTDRHTAPLMPKSRFNISECFNFCRAMLCKCGLCHLAVSVRLSVTFMYSVKMSTVR